MGKLTEILRKAGNILFPSALFREWPFMLIFCMMSAPFPCYFLLRAIYLPSVWFPALRDVLIVLFFAWICARVIVIFKRKWMQIVLRTVFYIFVITEFTFFLIAYGIFNLGISPDIFVMILQTNTHEAAGFLKTFVYPVAPYVIIILGLICVIIALLERYQTRIRAMIARRQYVAKFMDLCQTVISIGIIIGAIFTLPLMKMFALEYSELRKSNIAESLVIGTSADTSSITDTILLNCIYSVCYLYKGNKEMHKWIKLQSEISNINYNTALKNDSLEIVFIIGESYIRSHSQLYGYAIPTTPFQMQENTTGNLIALKNISTTAKGTDVSISNIMNLSNISLHELWQEHKFFPMILKKAGWDIYYYDNNTINNGMVHFMSHGILMSDEIIRECYTNYRVSDSIRFDYKVVNESFSAFTGGKECNRFTIYHLNGQHVPFKGAVPEGWERFGVEDYRYRKEPWMDDEYRQMIADYDNATLANDSVMGMIYNHFRDKNAVVVYISDHGEEVYDYRNSMGRKNRTDNTLEQYIESYFMVPATVWMSPKFKELYPGKVDAIKKAATRRGSTDDIGHFILGLAEVSSPYYRPERDIASDSYKPIRRLTTEGFYIDPED